MRKCVLKSINGGRIFCSVGWVGRLGTETDWRVLIGPSAFTFPPCDWVMQAYYWKLAHIALHAYVNSLTGCAELPNWNEKFNGKA
jgi:hypothetical protein